MKLGASTMATELAVADAEAAATPAAPPPSTTAGIVEAAAPERTLR